jgi:hypothetical protein
MLWSPNTQLHYPFQNQALDYSGNARHGTINGTGAFATKPLGGRCLYFDGVGDYVATPSFGLSGTVVVFAADVRCKSNAGFQVFFGDLNYSGTAPTIIIFRYAGLNRLSFQYADGSTVVEYGASNYFLAPYNDAWLSLLVACDYPGKKLYVFRDASLVNSFTLTGTPLFPSTNSVKYIGSGNTTQYPLTDGYLANVYLATLATCPPVAALTANANRLMMGLNPIWSV